MNRWIITLIALLLLFIGTQPIYAQKNLPNSVLKLIPAGWKIDMFTFAISVDLNNDGIKDYVLVVDSVKSIPYPDDISHADSVYYPNSVLILFGRGKGKYQLILQTSKIFGKYCGGIQGNPPFRGIGKKANAFTMEFISGGSSGRQESDYTFKYINNDFYLTRSEYSEYELPIDDYSDNNINIDYLKKTIETFDTRKGKKIHYKKKMMKKKPLTKLKDFVDERDC
jgi:hypothetical protein